MSHPRIEEVSDDEMADDPDEMDVEQFDFARPQHGSLATAQEPSPSRLPPEVQALLQSQATSGGGGGGPAGRTPPFPQMSEKERERYQREQLERSKAYQCLYPVYFDRTRSRDEGRRVGKAAAVANPLAREIVDALQHIGTRLNVPLQVVLEPTKTHPKDWANPGRVKVLIKKDGKPVSPKIQNKYHLYALISEHLQAHPTTEDSPLRLRMQGLPMPKDKIPPPAIPRGSKMSTILPLHSPALSGGGVSDNFLKDMMAEMGGQLPPGMAGMAGLAGAGDGAASSSQPKKVKDKKKK